MTEGKSLIHAYEMISGRWKILASLSHMPSVECEGWLNVAFKCRGRPDGTPANVPPALVQPPLVLMIDRIVMESLKIDRRRQLEVTVDGVKFATEPQ